MFTKFLILLIIISSTISLMLIDFFLMWMFLEITSLIFASFLNLNKMKKSSMLFFLISSISSFLMLYSYMYSLNLDNKIEIYNIYDWMLIFSIWMKMGLPPFHMWMLLTLKFMSYESMYIYFSFIKITPMIILYNFIEINYNFLMLLFILMLIIPLITFLKTPFKLIFSCSSIYHSTVMITIMFMNMESWLIYLITYMYSSFYLFYFLSKFNFESKKDLMITNHLSNFDKNLLIYLILMYCQFPPMATFVMKMLTIDTLTKCFEINSMIILISISSMIMTYIYLERFTPLFFFNKCSYYSIFYKKTIFNTKMYHRFILISLIVILFLPMI